MNTPSSTKALTPRVEFLRSLASCARVHGDDPVLTLRVHGSTDGDRGRDETQEHGR